MGIKFTNLNKILYPEDKITKKHVVEYLNDIHDLIMPYIRNRLLSFVRCPDGYKKQCFFQKHPSKQDEKFLSTLKIGHTSGSDHYMYLKNQTGLLYLAQMAVLEIHPWGSHIRNIELPDVVLFDLDPSPSCEWKNVVYLAHFMREELEKQKLVSFVKTTGGKGLHIVVPIKPKHSWDEIKTFSHAFATYIATKQPHLCTPSMSKTQRRGKIFIDYVRNTRGATAVAPYSLRARTGATIAMPLDWEELTAKIHSNSFTIKNYAERLKKLKKDPWEEFYKIKQTLKLK